MIKQIYVCECDICGAIENAKATTWRNETEYEIPDNWVRGNNKKICICPECNKKLNAKTEEPETLVTPNMQFAPMYGCPAPYEVCIPTIGSGVTVDPVIISADIPNTESQVVLDTINEYLLGLKVYCESQDSCKECPIAYSDEKCDMYGCSLTDTPVFEWQDIADKLKDEHKVLAEHIEIIAKHCKDDMGNCEDCRYCRSYERCDLRLHNPADWVIYDDNNK